MIHYIVRKLLLTVPLLWGVITLIFVMLEASPGDAADRFFTPETPPEVRQMVEKKWGLDQPAPVRYLKLIKNLTIPRVLCEVEKDPDNKPEHALLAWWQCPQTKKTKKAVAAGEAVGWHARNGGPVIGLDFGRSISQERPVFQIIGEALPNTVVLSGVSMFFIYVTGVLLGTMQAVRQYSWMDNIASMVSLFVYSMPGFWLALMLILLFSLKLDLLPAAGMRDAVMYDFMSPTERFWDQVEHILLPGVGLGIAFSAGVARFMRSSMLDVIRQDFIRTARAKGLHERTVVFKHGMRNSLLPIITLVGLNLPFLFSGSVLIEYIFAWPGMGRVIVAAIFTQDTPLIIACFFVFTLLTVTGNLLADFAYTLVDPRIRLS